LVMWRKWIIQKSFLFHI